MEKLGAKREMVMSFHRISSLVETRSNVLFIEHHKQ